MQRQQERRRETEQKAQQKYKDWLQRKNQEKIEKEKKEKVIRLSFSCLSFLNYKQFLRDFFCIFLTGRSPYDKSYPSPSFVNPIPWKPIHVPPPEPSSLETSSKKPLKQRKSQQSLNPAWSSAPHTSHIVLCPAVPCSSVG
uniref:Coiled-coil domain containing 34 n=1 Tax=Oreochromis aureus TaxID=47969 RepID=A0AAZ1Y306_OREAU